MKYTLLICSFFSCSLFGQDIEMKSVIDCNFTDAIEFLRYTDENNIWYKVYPNNLKLPSDFKDSKLIHGIIDYDQVVFQSCNDEIWAKKRLDHFINRWGLDTLECSPDYINSFINGAIGYCQGKESYILDENNNLDLTDDKIYQITDSIYIHHNIVIDRFINQKIIQDTITIQVLTPRLDRENNQVLGLFFRYCKYWKSNFTLNNTSVELIMYPGDYNVYHKQPRIIIKTSDSTDQNIIGYQYFKVKNNYYKISSISKSGSQISVIKQPGQIIPTSNQIGYCPPNLQITDSLNLMDLRGKYIYLYFWNYDCAPCLNNLPKKFAKYSSSDYDNVEFVLISVDKPEETRRFLKKNNITWTNIETYGNSHVYNDYNIYFFPSEYLINPKGVIIDKTDLITGFQVLNIDKYISE